MKHSVAILVSVIALVCLLSAPKVLAQSITQPQRAQSNEERMLKDLLDEVRELRTAVQRIEANTIRAQVIIERQRAQQEQVLRLTREVTGVRDAIIEFRNRQQRLKEDIPELEKQVQAGVVSNKGVQAAIRELEELKQREQGLLERETQLSTDLAVAKSLLLDLNDRLDAIERGIVSPASNDAKPPARKQQ